MATINNTAKIIIRANANIMACIDIMAYVNIVANIDITSITMATVDKANNHIAQEEHW